MLTFSNQCDIQGNEDAVSLMERAFGAIVDEKDSGKAGYYTLPRHSASLFDEIKSIDTTEITQLVVIGIGGSSLGIKAIDAMLRPYTPEAKEIIYLENSDPLTITHQLKSIDKAHALFFVISKSGSTIETTSIFKTLIGYHALDIANEDTQRIIIITDEGSVLSEFAKHHKLREFNIPTNVGGRFSVLSAVGVVPLTLAGYSMDALLLGAEGMIERFFSREEEHILHKAYYLYSHAADENINILFSYSDILNEFTKWYVQLWGESLGKIDSQGESVGLTPIGLIGAIDQHSFLQLIVEGPKNKNVTFIKIEDFQSPLTIPDISLHGIEKTDFINTQSFNRLINTQCEATRQSLIDVGVRSDMIVLDRVSEENIGQLIVYFELLTSLVGAMFGINTYDQPGVERGKQLLYERLTAK